MRNFNLSSFIAVGLVLSCFASVDSHAFGRSRSNPIVNIPLLDPPRVIVTNTPTPTATPNYGVTPPDQTNPNLTEGPYSVSGSEYHLPAAIDSSVLPGVYTEVWGKLYYPTNSSTTQLPLIMFLHGNHVTCSDGNIDHPTESCSYTATGSCPAGQSVVNNHLGYEYLASRLASFGYLVVSINANRGITCGAGVTGDTGLNLARGRLILRHLAWLARWSTNGGAPSSVGINLVNRINFNQVGLFGHSRAGEGVRAAYTLYNDAGSPWPATIGPAVNVRGIFEIGPIDGQTSRTLNAIGTAWNVLLPMCDGDVMALDGMKPYDRMSVVNNESTPSAKSMFAVWGANHNFYNTAWTTNESGGCVGSTPLFSGNGTSQAQQNTAVMSVIPFFRAHVGVNANADLAGRFDPKNNLPDALSSITRVDRAYETASHANYVNQLENFLTANHSITQNNVVSMTTTVAEHDATLRAAKISWAAADNTTYFEDLWNNDGAGASITSATSFDFRVSRTNSAANLDASTDFQIQLVYADHSLSAPVNLSQYASLIALTGEVVPNSATGATRLHEVLQSVRIPISAFTSAQDSLVRGVRFTFNRTASGEIVATHFAISQVPMSSSGPAKVGIAPPNYAPPFSLVSMIHSAVSAIQKSTSAIVKAVVTSPDSGSTTNRIVSVTPTSNGMVDVEIESSEKFPVRDALPILQIDGAEAAVGSFSRPSDLHFMKFTMSAANVAQLPNTVSLSVSHREDPTGPTRVIGSVAKATLQVTQ